MNKGYVYFIVENPFNGRVKIGRTSQISNRLSTLQTGNASELIIYAMVYSADCVSLEYELHTKYAEHRTRGEWFTFTPAQLTNAARSLIMPIDHPVQLPLVVNVPVPAVDNSITRFANNVKFDMNRLNRNDLYQHYKTFCHNNGYKVVCDKQLFDELIKLGYITKIKRTTVREGNKRANYYMAYLSDLAQVNNANE